MTPSPLPSGLGPQCIGLRVVVRRLLPGQTGPSGGPAMTDLLGVLEAWDDTTTLVRAEDGTTTRIAIADIVAGKPVPERPSPRQRVRPEDACRMSNASWPPVHSEPLGDWLLRASGGFSARANSVMATGDPGVPVAEAFARVRAFYAHHALPVWAQVVVGSDVQRLLDDAGWPTARPGEADSHFQLASVAQAARAVRRLRPAHAPEAEVSASVSEQWLVNDERATAHHDDAVRVLEGPAQVGFASVLDVTGAVVAKGRIGGEGDWAGITDVWVSPARRREGLGLVVMAELLEWAGERGATTTYLQVRGDNAAGLALYERLGFTTHHTYRYLREP